MLRTTKSRLWLAGALSAAALAAPAQALASDQSVYDAFASSDFSKLSDAYVRGERHWENSGFVTTGQALKAVRRINALVHKTKVRMSHEDPDTDAGRKGENLALRSLDLRRASALNNGRALRAFTRFDGAGYIRLTRKARNQIKLARHKRAEAISAFKSAGVSL